MLTINLAQIKSDPSTTLGTSWHLRQDRPVCQEPCQAFALRDRLAAQPGHWSLECGVEQREQAPARQHVVHSGRRDFREKVLLEARVVALDAPAHRALKYLADPCRTASRRWIRASRTRRTRKTNLGPMPGTSVRAVRNTPGLRGQAAAYGWMSIDPVIRPLQEVEPPQDGGVATGHDSPTPLADGQISWLHRAHGRQHR